jgi:hypothetical protein
MDDQLSKEVWFAHTLCLEDSQAVSGLDAHDKELGGVVYPVQ